MKLHPIVKFVVCFVCVLTFVLVSHQAIGQTPINKATITAILEGNQVFIQDKLSKIKDVAQKNQQIRTGKAKAELTFNNKAVARLGTNSKFTVGECGVQLQEGTALISGAPGCTKGVTAAVRGTTYVLKVNAAGTEEYQVLEGTVDFGKTSSEDPHKWEMSGGDRCILEPNRKGVIRAKISRREYTRVLRGNLFRGYETDQNRFERLQTTYAKLYPNARFPIRRGALSPFRGHYFLTIRQEKPQLKEVIARVSWQRRRNDIYLPERFVGDFLFPVNQKAQFIRGLQPLDRISVRLFDRENNFLGYTEFEGLDENAAVTLILPSDPKVYGTVRTVFGDDLNRDGVIDSDALTYDYFSVVKPDPQNIREKLEVAFPKELEDVRRSSFEVAGIPGLPNEQEFPDTFYDSLFSPVDRAVRPFNTQLEPDLLLVPGTKNRVVPVKPDGSSTFEVPKEILKYRSRRLISDMPN